MAKKTKSAHRDKPRERRERRFQPRPTVSPAWASALGAAGALVMGAGAWEQFAPLLTDGGPPQLKIAPYVLVTGAVLVAVAIWIGTSGEATLRVGAAGVAVDKGAMRRIPWFAVERIEWRGEAVRVLGKDESGTAMTVVATLASQPQAAAWIVREARERIPAVVDVPADATLPEPSTTAGELVRLDPPQVVGRRCAASDTIIAYEPDARICRRCERIYHAAHVPETCACGASLADLRSQSKTA